MGAKYSYEEFARRLGAEDDPKLNAAADFTARLLNGPLGERVMRVILFGSVARGEAHPGSDVDVMVFADAPRRALAGPASSAAWETTLAWAESLEHLLYPLGDLVQPRSYVVYNALKRGREIYGMPETEIRRREAWNLFEKANHHWLQSQTVMRAGAFELAIVGACTAAELAAKALLLLKEGVDLPSTHGGPMQIFGREYILTGEAPAAWGQLLRQHLEVRRLALYDTTVKAMTAADAQPVLDLARDMLDFLQNKLSQLSEAEEQT
ncbi:MAG: nucleotidyltransferase domain-containing protein [Anaerolineales bacterium]|nr:nucleotidyltransferase domain-containing protein [Anaerolineales bacterium]